MGTVERPRDEQGLAEQTTPAEEAEARTEEDDAWARPSEQTPAGEEAEAERQRLLGEAGGPAAPDEGGPAAPAGDDGGSPAAVAAAPGSERGAAPDSPREEPEARDAAAVEAGEPAPAPAAAAGVGPEDYPEGTRLPQLDQFRGIEVCDPDGERVGRVDHVYLDRHDGYVRYIGVKTARIGGHYTVVPIDDVREEGGEGDRYLTVPYSRQQLEAGPAFDEPRLTPDHETAIYGYYRRIGYWDRARELLDAKQSTPAPTREIAEAEFRDAIAHGEDLEGIRVTRWEG